MSKRAAVFVALLIGIALWFLLIASTELPADIVLIDSISKAKFFLAFWLLTFAISAAATIAMRPERWDQKLDRDSTQQSSRWRWIWPLFLIFFSAVNYLLAIAVFAANLAFTPKKKASDGL